MDTYTFDEKKHVHILNGKALTGCTTILGVIAKPALIQWSANEAVKYLQDIFEKEHFLYDNDFKEAKVAHRKKKEEAGVSGTDVHAEVEDLIKRSIEASGGIIDPDTKSDNEQVQHFIDWAITNKVKFRASEEHIYSKEWWVGGICDFLCEISEELWVGDIKTSSAIYPEHFFQTAGYQKMYEEMGLHKNFKGNLILNLRKDGTFEEKRSISNEDNLLAFQSALNLYRVQEKIKGTII